MRATRKMMMELFDLYNIGFGVELQPFLGVELQPFEDEVSLENELVYLSNRGVLDFQVMDQLLPFDWMPRMIDHTEICRELAMLSGDD